jgi:hypothetical protein
MSSSEAKLDGELGRLVGRCMVVGRVGELVEVEEGCEGLLSEFSVTNCYPNSKRDNTYWIVQIFAGRCAVVSAVKRGEFSCG